MKTALLGLLTLLAPVAAFTEDTFGQVTFINATALPGVQLTIDSDYLGSEAGLGPAEFDGPYVFTSGPYGVALKETGSGTIHARSTIDLTSGCELLIVAHQVWAGESGEEPTFGLQVFSRDELYQPSDEATLHVISYLPEHLATFVFNDERAEWAFGSLEAIADWPRGKIEAKGGDGEWEAFLEWSRDRAEFEKHQIVIVFSGPAQPLLARHVFFFDEE